MVEKEDYPFGPGAEESPALREAIASRPLLQALREAYKLPLHTGRVPCAEWTSTVTVRPDGSTSDVL